MNRLILILSLCFGVLAYSQKNIADYPNAEIYRYLKPFEENSSYYIGKPFSVLLNDLVQYKPLSIVSGIMHSDIHASPDTDFRFTSGGALYRYGITMTVVWETPVSMFDSLDLIKKYNNAFTEEVKNFYAGSIVKKIYLRYNTSDDAPLWEFNIPPITTPPGESTSPRDLLPVYGGDTPTPAK